VKTETLQDGAAFVWQVEKGCDGSGVYCFDSLARPLKISRASTVATALTGDNPVLPPSKAPTLLAPATNSTGSYAVTWTSVASASTYQLRERLDGGAWETAYNGDALTTTVSGRGEGDWDYQARACNSAGCSVWSAVETTKVRLPP